MEELTELKVALVHDKLSEYGGAEKTLQYLLEIFPDADVYTSYADKIFIQKFFPKLTKSKLHISWLQNILVFPKYPSLLQIFMPLIWKTFNLINYDIVISGPSFLLCNLIKVKNTLHIQYIHSLPQNLVGIMSPVGFQRLIPYTQLFLKYYEKALKSSPIIANSRYVKSKLNELFGVESEVIYPPIDIPKKCPIKKKGKYYMTVSRLSKEKGPDLAIKACTELKIRLKVIGISRDIKYKKYLKSIAGPSVEFLGFQDSLQLEALYLNAIALIFPSKNEDFGMSVVEAMAHGVPVIAYNNAGPKEIIAPNITGIFFDEYNVESLVTCLKKFNPAQFQAKQLYFYAKKFNKERYKKQIINFIKDQLSGQKTKF